MSLTNRILVAMILGILIGLLFNWMFGDSQQVPLTGLSKWLQEVLVDNVFDAVGQIFIKSLKLLVVPMVFVSLVCGSASLGGHSRVGVMALKTIVLYLATTALAITLALAMGSLVRPGDGIDLVSNTSFSALAAPSLKETFINIFPSNPIQAMAEGNMLQVIVFSLLLGIALARSDNSTSRNLLAFFNDFNNVILKMVMLLMHLAPYGVFCLLAKLFTSLGIDALGSMGKYFGTVIFVLLLHGICSYGVLLKILSGLSPVIFFRKMWSVMVFGFSTASSNATLPITLRTVEKDLGVDNKVASFSVPLGATINMDGTAIMQGVATVFIAQVYQIDIGLSGYLLVILTATLASIGTAGVPGVGLVTLAMVLQQVGLPVEGIALIVGVDRLLDMIRTAVNITGDAMVSTVVAKSEGLLNRECYESMNNNLSEEKS